MKVFFRASNLHFNLTDNNGKTILNHEISNAIFEVDPEGLINSMSELQSIFVSVLEQSLQQNNEPTPEEVTA